MQKEAIKLGSHGVTLLCWSRFSSQCCSTSRKAFWVIFPQLGFNKMEQASRFSLCSLVAQIIPHFLASCQHKGAEFMPGWRKNKTRQPFFQGKVWLDSGRLCPERCLRRTVKEVRTHFNNKIIYCYASDFNYWAYFLLGHFCVEFVSPYAIIILWTMTLISSYLTTEACTSLSNQQKTNSRNLILTYSDSFNRERASCCEFAGLGASQSQNLC